MTSKFLKNWLWLFYFPIAIIYMEFILKFWAFSEVLPKPLAFTTLLSAAIGFFGTLACCAGKKFSNRLFITLLVIATFIISAQAVYYKVFRTFVTVYSITQVGGVIGDFGTQMATGIMQTLPVLIPISIPLILWIIFMKKIVPCRDIDIKVRGMLCAGFTVFQISASVLIMNSDSGIISVRRIYSKSLVPELSMNYLGALTTLRVDIRELMLTAQDIPPEQDPIATPAPTPEATEEPVQVIEYGPNILEINFDELIENEEISNIKDMHSYFSALEPTYQNEYTGYFEGKNLIWIVAEGFSSLALDKKHTPTLCKLTSEGFVFNNFYNPLWGVSTSDGEYVTLTGLIPKVGVWSFSKSSKNYMPFSLGHLMKEKSYRTLAYHNHTYTYYDRHLSHPNMGYDFVGMGNGLDIKTQWPQSDLEMIEVTADNYVNQPPFHVYYLTVSGHMFYTFSGNMMAAKHMEEVSDLPYSEKPRAYIACNMELDLALEELITRLDKAGQLENTVIALSGDHYPYGLEMNEIAELAGKDVDPAFGLYESTLILWSGDMDEPIAVDKPCSSLDIMPTLANLFNLPYDSRLVMGRDVFSDSDPLVVFSNRSFLTDKGKYNAVTNAFVPAEGLDWSEDEANQYAVTVLEQVESMFKYSAAILDNDYYAKVIKK